MVNGVPQHRPLSFQNLVQYMTNDWNLSTDDPNVLKYFSDPITSPEPVHSPIHTHHHQVFIDLLSSPPPNPTYKLPLLAVIEVTKSYYPSTCFVFKLHMSVARKGTRRSQSTSATSLENYGSLRLNLILSLEPNVKRLKYTHLFRNKPNILISPSHC